MSEGLSFATAVDISGFEEGIRRIEEGIRSAASNVEGQSERIQSLFSDIPEFDIEFVTNMPQTADEIAEAYAEINRVTRLNEEAIAELTQEYNRLTGEINKFQNVPQKSDDVAKWQAERQAIKENVSLRKEMIAKTQELTKVVEANENAFTKHQKTQGNVKMRIREVMNEMAALRNEAQMNGQEIDESSGRYRELAEELGRLKDIQGDVATQARILSNDENQFQGVISGLSGLSGGFAAAQGAMALFGSENENLQKVMTQLQAVMAITMGLQQVQQMLNKDSAFRLVTLNSLRSLWNKLMGESNAVTAVNNAETTTNVTATEAQASATEKATVAEETNTTAQAANTTAQAANTAAAKAGTAGKVAEATATEGATVAQNAHTGAMVAGTVATKAMAVAMRVLKLALISTGIGALIVLVGELVSWITELCTAEDEAVKHAQDINKVHEEAAKTYIQEKLALEDNIRMCQNFSGTKEQEKKKVDELNSKYGEALGYYDSLEQWERVLTERGPAYCEMLRMKAVQQGLLNKYVEAYVAALEVAHKAENGEFDSWWTGKFTPSSWFDDDKKNELVDARRKKITDAADAETEYWKEAMEQQRADLEAYQKANHFDVVHIDPNKKTVSGNGGKTGNTFDPKEAARKQKEAIKQWEDAVKQYIKEANAEVNQANIDAMEDGLEKELAQIQAQTESKKRAWEEHLLQLATAFKASEKAYYLAQKGHTEEGWEASDRGKMTVADYADEILDNPANADLAKLYYDRLEQITDTEEQNIIKIRQKYQDQWIKQYGNDRQKEEMLNRQWTDRLGRIAKEAPDALPQALEAMGKEFRELDFSKFKNSINWDEVFGNLGDQSLTSLQITLNKLKTEFNNVKDSLKVDEIKTYQDAITSLENEIASRNPFTAMHKSFKDISSSKEELVNALAEFTTAQNELNAASSEYQDLMAQRGQLLDIAEKSNQNDELVALSNAQEKVIEKESAYQSALERRNQLEADVASGDFAADSEELASAINAVAEAERLRNEAIEARNEAQSAVTDQEAAQATIALVSVNDQLAASTTRLATAQTKNAEAEQKVITARNSVTRSYKQFATQLKSCGGVVTDIGGKAKKLARIFSDDIAESMEKAIDFIDEVLDATSDVISAIGDVGKSVAESVEATVDGVSQGTQATAQAAATSISTVEKASVILTIISAALQIATAIANLFNNDDQKQEEIDRLQQRIDQLQWELDNQDAVRLQSNYGNALTKLRRIYVEARQEVLKLHGVTQYSSQWVQWIAAARHSAEIYAKTVQKIADYWGSVSYTADKALGSQRYESSRKQLENLAEQQLLLQKQMNEEASKKDSDDSKIQDYKNQIAELAEEMATLINDMLEDIIGASAEDIASQLGDAFFEAVQAGEDAMEAWHDKVNEIVADILKRMMIQKFLEEPIGEIFDKYKKKWFGSTGEFAGIDAVINSMDEFSDDINQVGEMFQSIMNELPDDLYQWFLGDSDREASSRGIATASQDSVDENNARLTVIQTHTYTLVQGLQELNGTANAILERVTGIEINTAETNNKLDELGKRTKRVADTLETIQTSGLKLK